MHLVQVRNFNPEFILEISFHTQLPLQIDNSCHLVLQLLSFSGVRSSENFELVLERITARFDNRFALQLFVRQVFFELHQFYFISGF